MQQHDRVAQEIDRLAQQWMAAAGAKDAETLDQMMAPEYRLVIMTMDGTFHEVVDRETWISETLRRDIQDFAYIDVHVQVDGNVAVMTSRSASSATIARDEGEHSAGTTRRIQPHLTDIWVRRNGQWWVALRHSIRL